MNYSVLNPFRSLFSRIFVWFWLATGMMLLAALLIINQQRDHLEVLPLTSQHTNLVTRFEKSLAQYQNANFNLNRILRRLGNTRQWLIISVDKNNDKVDLSFPRPLLPKAVRFKEYIESENLLLFKTKNAQFVGPFLLEVSDNTRHLFVGRLLPKEERPDKTWIFVYVGFFVLILGSCFCVFLVWHLTKPINKISQASKSFAQGKLEQRVVGFETRNDEIGQLSKDFNDMASNIQSMVENQQMLMANISHELRTPLTRMQLALALIEGNIDDAEQTSLQRKNMLRLEKDITCMDQMIEQILAVSKAQANYLQVAREPVEINTLINELVEQSELEASSRSVKVLTQLDILASAILSEEQVKSALENVLRNAIKYAQTKVLCSLFNEAGMLVIRIEDDGIGVEDGALTSLFEPFFRINNTQTKQETGAGLGLAIAKASIEANQGSITAHRSQLGGLSVVIKFPLGVSSSNETIIRKST